MLAIATIEKQECNPKMYNTKTALFEGTVFPELNLPFFATESLDISNAFSNAVNEQEQLLNQITMEGFFLDDLMLYLDTHSNDENVIKIFEEHLRKKEELEREFAEKYFPLTRHNIPYSKNTNNNFNKKEEKPAWEGVCH